MRTNQDRILSFSIQYRSVIVFISIQWSLVFMQIYSFKILVQNKQNRKQFNVGVIMAIRTRYLVLERNLSILLISVVFRVL